MPSISLAQHHCPGASRRWQPWRHTCTHTTAKRYSEINIYNSKKSREQKKKSHIEGMLQSYTSWKVHEFRTEMFQCSSRFNRSQRKHGGGVTFPLTLPMGFPSQTTAGVLCSEIFLGRVFLAAWTAEFCRLKNQRQAIPNTLFPVCLQTPVKSAETHY